MWRYKSIPDLESQEDVREICKISFLVVEAGYAKGVKPFYLTFENGCVRCFDSHSSAV